MFAPIMPGVWATGVLLSTPWAARPESATGPLAVCAANPRYFADSSGEPVYLAGAHDGWELQDYAWGDRNPGVLFDWSGLGVEFHPITLDRFKGLLMESLSPAAVGGASG